MSSSIEEIINTKGYIYIISNAGMPDLFKIGKTSRTPDDRLNDILQHTTWVSPYPYIVEWAVFVDDINTAEKRIHKILNPFRVNKRREWFKIEKNQIPIDLYDSDSGCEYSIDFLSVLSFDYVIDELKRIFMAFIGGKVVKNNKLFKLVIDDEGSIILKPDLLYKSDKDNENNVIAYQNTISGELIEYKWDDN